MAKNMTKDCILCMHLSRGKSSGNFVCTWGHRKNWKPLTRKDVKEHCGLPSMRTAQIFPDTWFTRLKVKYHLTIIKIITALKSWRIKASASIVNYRYHNLVGLYVMMQINPTGDFYLIKRGGKNMK